MAARVPEILVVEDSLEARALYVDLLGEARFEVTVAENGVSALASMSRRMPDLVVLDMQMPAMSGLELLERMREYRASAPPVVAVSGFESLERAALMRGARAFLRKPVLAADLLAVIDAALAGVSCTWGRAGDLSLSEQADSPLLPTAECSRAFEERRRSSCP